MGPKAPRRVFFASLAEAIGGRREIQVLPNPRQHGHPLAEGIVRQLRARPVEFCVCDEQLSLAATRIKA
jgi:hypothetical protein